MANTKNRELSKESQGVVTEEIDADKVVGYNQTGYYTTQDVPEGYTIYHDYESGNGQEGTVGGQLNGEGYSNSGKVDYAGQLATQQAAAKQQIGASIDYGVRKNVNSLRRAQEDAEKQFQTQQNQVDLDEAKALDNQALYAEARGDRGGIGQSQYAQIQNTAMENRLAIHTARTELATNTARQIADLRAQGEFKKADAVLQLTQDYLSQLVRLEQWNAQYNLDVAQFNAQLSQWKEKFMLDEADVTGTYKGETTWASKKAEKQEAQKLVDAMVTQGINVPAELIAQAGYTPEYVQGMLLNYRAEQQRTIKAELAKEGKTLLQSGIMPSTAQWRAMGYKNEDDVREAVERARS